MGSRDSIPRVHITARLTESDMQIEEDFSQYLKTGMKIEKIPAGKNRVIYSLSDVPCAKKRQTKKGQLHNPIFTPGIFSGVGTQNEAAQTKSA